MVANVSSWKVMEKVGLMHQRTWFYGGPDPIPGAELGDVEHALTLNQWLRRDRR
jgi:RimJ/RimL family protein N-acetyltransferase